MTDPPDLPAQQPAAPPAEPPPPAPLVPAQKRPLLARLFAISVWGGVKLAGLCVLVGFFVMAASFDPGDPDFNIGEALGAVVRRTFSALGWMIRNFWQPLLAGALVVLPVWVIWRVISLPFRK